MATLTPDYQWVITNWQLGTWVTRYPVAFFFHPEDIRAVAGMFRAMKFCRIVDVDRDAMYAFQNSRPLIMNVDGLFGRMHIGLYKMGICTAHVDGSLLSFGGIHDRDEAASVNLIRDIREDWLPKMATFEYWWV